MKKYKIFRAWQNQNKQYTSFISKILKEVLKLQLENGVEIELITYPAQDETGSPDIVGKIWEHIFSCDIFIGDLTQITSYDELHISNSNVMYEAGIADAILGPNRVILLCSEYTEPSKLAFDINHKRISKIDSTKKDLAIKSLNEWIESALIKADEQNFHKRYLSNELNKKLFVLYNNFLRMLFSKDCNYSKGILPPKKEDAVSLLKDAQWNQLMLECDYSSVLEFIQSQIMKLSVTFDSLKVKKLLDIYNSLSDYQKIKELTSYELYQRENELVSYLLQTADNYKLNSLDGFDSFKEMPLFQKNIVYICGNTPFENVFLKECITTEVYEKCNYQVSAVENGAVSGLKMYCYSLKSENHDIFAEKITNILSSIYNYMTFEKYQPTQDFASSEIKSIICWNPQ